MNYQELFNVLHLYDVSVKFDFYRYSEHLEIKEIARQIIEEMQKQKITQNISKKSKYRIHDYIKTLLCNFFIAYRTKKCVAIPRKKSYYSARSNFAFGLISYHNFILCVDFLKSKQYIEEKKGYKAFGGNTSGKTSKYWALPKLYEQFRSLDVCDISTPPQREIILKDESKNRVNFEDTLATAELKNKLENINGLYEKFDFRATLDSQRNTTRLFPRLTAIYNNSSFADGGRLYCIPQRGVSYQTLNKVERSKIIINLEKTVELDYSSLHLSMLYAMRNIQLLSDPYSFDDDRAMAKKTILVLLNAKTECAALKALNKEFQYTIDFKPIILAAKQYHAPIAEYFGSGIGIKLQNFDAKIALNVVSHFAAKGIPCLPVHDSFIIARRHKDELKQAMIYYYNMLFHRNISVHE